MILVDTSAWIDHFRHNNPTLGTLLEEGLVVTHPFVIGELACGTMKNRAGILADLQTLETVTIATNAEVIQFIEKHRLYQCGIGWIDAHLLASARLSHCWLWSLDKGINKAGAAAGAQLYDQG